MPTDLRAVLSQLRVAPDLDAGGGVALLAMFEVLDDTLDRSPDWSSSLLLRGTAHLRGAGEYKGLVVREYSNFGLHGAVRIVPSASTWRWMEQHRQPAVLEVATGAVHPLDVGSDDEVGVGAAAVLHTQSVQLIAQREATHVLLLPLRAGGDALLGVIGLELASPCSLEQLLALGGACVGELETLADLVGPNLAAISEAASPVVEVDPLMPVVGRKMAGLLKLLSVFAEQEETILISGPTGAGKSRLAEWCHARSLRKDGPLVTVQLHTVPEELQMPTLFGWRKGAFTGAVRDQEGEISRARGGTLFLDEVGKLSLEAQTGLLRLLETRQYRVMGASGGERTADLRFIIGTNQDLSRAVAEGRFLEDLYFRIHVLPVAIPALDERKDEVGPWVRFMARRRHGSGGLVGTVRVEEPAIAVLETQSWPGSLRQLDNVVRRAYAIALSDQLGSGRVTITAEHARRALGFESASPARVDGAGLWASLERSGQAWLQRAERGDVDLDHADAFRGLLLHLARVRCGGDITQAYVLLGRQAAVESRNHLRDFRRHMAHLQALVEALGRPVDEELRRSFEV